jgi:hypothetical protein
MVDTSEDATDSEPLRINIRVPDGFLRVHPLGSEQVFAPRPTLEEMNEALKSMQPVGTPDE